LMSLDNATRVKSGLTVADYDKLDVFFNKW